MTAAVIAVLLKDIVECRARFMMEKVFSGLPVRIVSCRNLMRPVFLLEDGAHAS